MLVNSTTLVEWGFVLLGPEASLRGPPTCHHLSAPGRHPSSTRLLILPRG